VVRACGAPETEGTAEVLRHPAGVRKNEMRRSGRRNRAMGLLLFLDGGGAGSVDGPFWQRRPLHIGGGGFRGQVPEGLAEQLESGAGTGSVSRRIGIGSRGRWWFIRNAPEKTFHGGAGFPRPLANQEGARQPGRLGPTTKERAGQEGAGQRRRRGPARKERTNQEGVGPPGRNQRIRRAWESRVDPDPISSPGRPGTPRDSPPPCDPPRISPSPSASLHPPCAGPGRGRPEGH